MIGSEGAKHVAEAIKVSVLLRLFWYQFHAHLTNCSTAVVCYYPQDMGAMTSLNLAGNAIGGYRQYGKFIATPEGTAFSSVAACMHCLSYPCYSVLLLIRSCCYR
jgi:hypothetical protein